MVSGDGLVAKLCPTLCKPMDCNPLGSSAHGISQARILEWVAISFSRGSSQPRDRTYIFCLAGGFFTTEPPGKPLSQFSRVRLCNPMDSSMPGFPVHHQPLELAQSHVHRVSDAIQPSHPLSSASPPAFNLSQHHGLFQWVSSLHQVAKVLELQLQHQPFQRTFRTDFL